MMRSDDVDLDHQRAMRVAVAMDVLSQLDLKQIKAMSNVYIRFDETIHNDYGYMKVLPDSILEQIEARADLRDVAAKAGSCTVCAIGASLLSYARLFDTVPTSPMFDEQRRSVFLRVTPDGNTDDARPVLQSLLGDEFTADIERVFEGYTTENDTGAEYDRHKYGSVGSEKRMRAIMHDVIDQGGEFTLPGYDDEEESDDEDY